MSRMMARNAPVLTVGPSYRPRPGSVPAARPSALHRLWIYRQTIHRRRSVEPIRGASRRCRRRPRDQGIERDSTFARSSTASSMGGVEPAGERVLLARVEAPTTVSSPIRPRRRARTGRGPAADVGRGAAERPHTRVPAERAERDDRPGLGRAAASSRTRNGQAVALRRRRLVRRRRAAHGRGDVDVDAARGRRRRGGSRSAGSRARRGAGAANRKSPERSPVKTRPVRLPPCAAGASPTSRTRAPRSPKPGTGRPQYASSRKRATFSTRDLLAPRDEARAAPAATISRLRGGQGSPRPLARRPRAASLLQQQPVEPARDDHQPDAARGPRGTRCGRGSPGRPRPRVSAADAGRRRGRAACSCDERPAAPAGRPRAGRTSPRTGTAAG